MVVKFDLIGLGFENLGVVFFWGTHFYFFLGKGRVGAFFLDVVVIEGVRGWVFIGVEEVKGGTSGYMLQGRKYLFAALALG